MQRDDGQTQGRVRIANGRGSPFLLSALLLIAAFSNGCALVRKGAMKTVTPMARQLSDGMMHQTDVDLVREGAPAFLLMLDALVEANPNNPTLLLAAADAHLAYASGFIDADQRERARTMYLKARNHGLQALSRNRRFARALEEGSLDEFEQALQRFRKRDADALMTTGMAWAMWIIASSDSPAAVGEMPMVLAIMERVRELDPHVRQGGVDLFYGIYYTVLPLGGGRDLDKARAHFERSMKIAGPDYLLTRVIFAEFYARYAFDRELYESTLTGVLDARPDVPEYTLMNQIAHIRARALLDEIDEYF